MMTAGTELALNLDIQIYFGKMHRSYTLETDHALHFLVQNT